MTDPAAGAKPIASGLILAGGASRRFGEPKPFASFRGRPLVRWVASVLEPLCDEILISIATRADEAAFRRAVPNARLVRDVHGNRGPIEGILRGFLEGRGPTMLVAPCDAPLLHPGLYGALARLLGDHEAAVPRPGSMDPVRAVYRRDAVLRALHRTGPGIQSPSALVDRLDAVFLEGQPLCRADPTLASFVDVNRRADLALVHHLVS